MARKAKTKPTSQQVALALPEPPPIKSRRVTSAPRKTKRFKLSIDKLHYGSYLAKELSMNLYAAARVSLDRHRHDNPVHFSITEKEYSENCVGKAEWQAPTDKHKLSYSYGKKRIEETAECIALATLRAVDKLIVRQRSEDLTGADWVVCDENGDLETAFRVEVSGIDNVHHMSEVAARLAAKVDQLKSGQQRVPDEMAGIAVVVGLSVPTVAIQRVDLTLDGMN